MAFRTSEPAVRGVLGYNYDAVRYPDLTPFIRPASLIVDRLAAAASGVYTFPAGVLAEVETWLAAYWYTKTDPLFTSRSTKGASGSFLRDEKVANPFLKGALDLDGSGLLAGILNGTGSARGIWLGKRPSEAVPYSRRD